MEKPDEKTVLKSVLHILREIPFFEDFSQDELNFFARNVSLRSFPAKTQLCKEGDFGDYMFFIVEGSVDISIASKDSNQKIIASLDRGNSVGELSLVEDYPRTAEITVSAPSELLILTRNRFESICGENPQVGIKFLTGVLKNLGTRLRKTSGRFADIS